MTDTFNYYLQNYNSNGDEVVLHHLNAINQIAESAGASILNSQKIPFKYEIFRDAEGWFGGSNILGKKVDGKTPSPMQSFKTLIATLPIDLAKQLVQIKGHKTGCLVPRIYRTPSEFEMNLAKDDDEAPIFFVSHLQLAVDDYGNFSVTVETKVGKEQTPYKLAMIFAELDQKYYSIFPVKIDDGSIQWKFVSTVEALSWEDTAYIDIKIVSADHFAASLKNKDGMVFYSRQ